ncbi:hypothetical protein COOONC_22685 [Cooperia oncophora]
MTAGYHHVIPRKEPRPCTDILRLKSLIRLNSSPAPNIYATAATGFLRIQANSLLFNTFTESSTLHSDGATPHSPVECTSTRTFEDAVDHESDRSGTELQELFVIKQEIDCLQAELEDMNENDLHDSNLECHGVDDGMSGASVHPSLPPIHPVEYLNPTSSIVCSKRLEETLAKDRGGLLEIPERLDGKLGRSEEPRYGRLLLTTSAPAASLREIMDSTLTSLKSFLHTGRIVPHESQKRVDVENSLCIAKANEREISAKRQDMTALSQHMRRRKPRRKRKLIRSQFGNARKRSMPSVNSVESEEAMNRKLGETRKRTMSVVSTTCDSSKSFKLVIRREKSSEFSRVPILEREGSLLSVSSAAETCYTHAKQNGQQQQPSSSSSEKVPLRSPIRIKIAPLKAPSTSCPSTLEKDSYDRAKWKSAEQTLFVDVNEPFLRVVKTEIDSDNDMVGVHEDMRSPEVREFRLRSMATLEEEALVESLRKLMGIRFVDTSHPSWFRKRYVQSYKILQMSYKLSAAKRFQAYQYTLMLIEQNSNTQELMLDLENFRRYREEELSRLKRQLEHARRSATVSEEQQW